MTTDGWSIAAFIFFLIGAIFGMIGLGLTVGIVTAFVGIPFLLLGIVFWSLVAGCYTGATRKRKRLWMSCAGGKRWWGR